MIGSAEMLPQDTTPAHWDDMDDDGLTNGHKESSRKPEPDHDPFPPPMRSTHLEGDPLLSARGPGSLFTADDPLLSKRSYQRLNSMPPEPVRDPLRESQNRPTSGAALQGRSVSSPSAPPGLQQSAPPGLAAQKPEEVIWQYRDPSGIVQGEHSSVNVTVILKNV
jgi:hypothetical protein